MKTLPRIRRNTPEEKAAINAGISEDPENPEITEDEWAQMVRVSDFGSVEETEAFLVLRDKLADVADDLGLSREAWDALSPNKPGFDERFAQVLDETAAKVRAVSAERVAAE